MQMAIQVVKFGNGAEPVLVLPDWFGGSAFCSDLGRWGDTSRYTYAVADYRGYGASRSLAGQYTLEEMAADALALADALGWSRFHVLGHSMSGKVMQLLVMHAPSRLKSAIALTPTPPIALDFDAGTRGLLESCESSLESRKGALGAATGSQYGEGFVTRLAEISMHASAPQAYRAYLDAWSRTDITPALAGSDFPLEIVIGDKDPFVPESAMRETLMPKFSQSNLNVLAGLGHYPLIEAPPRSLALFESIFAARS